MTEIPNPQKYDLEERTFKFAKRTRVFIKKVPKTITNIEDCKQLARSSGSVGANYIEANDSIGNRDFLLRVRICRKEAKESRYWLKLIDLEGVNPLRENEREELVQEANEIMLIFGSIVNKTNKVI